jgi:hypothetical protein
MLWSIRIWILGLQWYLLRRQSVILEDKGGELNARLVHRRGPFLVAKRLGLGIRNVKLLGDGKLENGAYVKTWHPLFPQDGRIS